MIVWCTIGMDGQTSFLFVQQYLEEDVLVLGTAAIEYELQAGGHGEDVGAPPAFAFNLVEIVGTQVIAVNA